MKIYIINDVRSPGKNAGMTNIQRQTYRDFEQILQKYYVTHGNILAHTYSPLYNQASPTRDEKAERDLGRHFNITLIRGMCFCGEIYHKYSNLYRTYLRNNEYDYMPEGYKLQELYQSIMYLVDKSKMNQLILDGKAEFMRLAKHSKTHTVYANPNEFLGEIYVHDRNDSPDADFIVIAAIPASIQANQRVDLINDIFPRIKETGTKADIIYFPNANMIKSKDPSETGNLLTSIVGTNIIRRILLVRSGKLEPTMII